MLDCIKQELVNARANIEAKKQAEIAAAKAKANQDVIEPELARIEQEKIKALQLAQESHDKAVNKTIALYEGQKEAYRQSANQKIEAKIEAAFTEILAALDKQLADE